MKNKHDVVIIGGGVTGLLTAFKLTEMGVNVGLVEQRSILASGPSTRNEGWLHRGTYHAASIKDKNTAVQVARRCIYGHEQLKRFCPEAIEGADVSPIALLRDKDRIDEVINRWDDAGVVYRSLSLNEAKRAAPEVDFEKAAHMFHVDDVSINTRLLYRKLFSQSLRGGCKFYLEHQVVDIDGQVIVLSDKDGGKTELEGEKIVYASGTGTRDIFSDYHSLKLPIRYWKSHLVITKRLTEPGVFYLDPHEAAMMHHGDFSVIGFNEDALMCDEPSYSVIKERASNIHDGIRRIFPQCSLSERSDVACVKVDFTSGKNDPRSLSIAIREPIPGHLIILPGKLTEAPFLTDQVASIIHNDVDTKLISERPCDAFSSTLSRNIPMAESA